jgi:hypothetical protein
VKLLTLLLAALFPRAALLDLMNAKFRVPSGPQVGAPHIDVVTGPCCGLFQRQCLALVPSLLLVLCAFCVSCVRAEADMDELNVYCLHGGDWGDNEPLCAQSDPCV